MEALGRLAGGVAHDFNNLLTAILGYGDMARRGLADDHEARRHVDEILKAADRGAELTRQLLAFSRHQAGEARSLSLNGVVSEVEGMLRRLIGEDIVLVSRLDAAGCRIRADRTQIDQVILNLVVNARDAMPRGGTLLIETAAVQVGEAEAWRQPEARPGSYVRLTVADTGCGMEPAVKEHAFEPFFTTKEEGRGTGLGLATVYGIVKQSGGFVSVDSEPDRGTIMQLYFPRCDDTFTALRPDPFESARGGGETLLVVEDEPPVLDLIGGVLASGGYTVLRARGGKEALDALAAPQRVDLIVADVVMPGIGGPELAQRAAALQPGVKVLFVSGYSREVAAPELDGAPFLQKPFTPDALLRKIREVIERTVDAGPAS
jgi:CheY-like chemotaxis protein